MGQLESKNLDNLDEMLSFVEAIFSQLNIGLLIYHLEDPGDSASLRLVYVNQKSSEYTGADLSELVGNYIGDAFPNLKGTEIPDTYAEVVISNSPITIGSVEYSDDKLEKGFYAVKAFPMPKHCVGVVFNNITARKKIDELIKSYSDQLREENKELNTLVAEISKDMKNLWY